MRVIGLAGWSGAGKTTLIARLIPAFTAQGLRVSTIKHAHHAFDLDRPGKDSYRHREAGATEVLVASDRRWALLHEREEARDPDLADLLSRLSPCDLVLVEGFRSGAYAKVEVHRAANAKPFLFPGDREIVGIASDAPPLFAPVPRLHLDDVEAIAALILCTAVPIAEVLRRLAAARG